MADVNNKGSATSAALIAAFTKILPSYDEEVFLTLLGSFPRKGRLSEIAREDFFSVFSGPKEAPIVANS